VFGGLATANGQAKSPVVVLDVTKVFKEHRRFKQDIELMAKEAQGFQTYLQQQEARLKDLAAKGQAAKVGSPEYRQIDEDMTRIRSDVQVQSQLKKKELMLQEAKIYFQYYNELQEEVGKFADANGITLVMRWNSEPIDSSDRMSVQQGVNKPVVYQRNLDITQWVINKINEGVPEPQPPRTGAAPTIPGRNF